MKAVGITCGIGSMLVGARQAGFKIAGNIEWRKYYHHKDEHGLNTFEANFPGSPFPNKLDELPDDEIDKLMGLDLALGHPECGNFSRLSGPNVKAGHDKRTDPSDIPLFVDLVAKLRPRFFVMDDLPGSFAAFPMSEYASRLPDYDLFPEWISNWGYGNPQKGRNRMFMLGSLRDERWAFHPGEMEHHRTVAQTIGDLPEPRPGANYPNHDPHVVDHVCLRALNLGGHGNRPSWREVQDHFADKGGGYTLEYPTKEGRLVKRIGFLKGHWDGPSHVLTGGNAMLHPTRCLPLTVRERARIQGFPDDFVFYGTKLNDRGEWNHEDNPHMVKQTGKAMPVEFCRYSSQQIAAHIQGEEFTSSGRRVINPHQLVDGAKRWFCENVGYSDQDRACASCWLYSKCTIRARKYQIGEPAVGQRDAFDPGVVPVKGEPSPEASRPKPRPPKPVREYRTVETKTLTFGGTDES